MMLTSRHRRLRTGGFTLVELLLAVTLLAGLMAAAVFGFSSLQRSAQLNEGVERVETAMRFARAHAANTGRKVQVVVTAAEAPGVSTPGTPKGNPDATGTGESAPSLSILWEADPARAPGVFEPIPSLSAEVTDVSELVEIRSVGRDSKGVESATASIDGDAFESGTAASAALAFPASGSGDSESGADPGPDTSTRAAGGSNPGETTITFYPDGSCDGATIVLASRDSDDVREVAVHLESVTGTTRRHWKESSSAAGTSESRDPVASTRGTSANPSSGTASPADAGSAVYESSPSRLSPRATASTTTSRGRR